MKLLKKYIEKNQSGTVRVCPEQAEDMWHLYNLILLEDKVKATTVRLIIFHS